jgi:hypothetical protein
LSADASRTLIGDDEHGWSDSAIFNFEGGCYAKVIRLSPEVEPEIYATTRRFGTILENAVIDPETRVIDLDDDSLAENSRASYPIEFIPNASADNLARVIHERDGPVRLNSIWPRISGSSAGCRFHMPAVGVMEEGRSPTGMRPTAGGQSHAAIVVGRLSK